MLTAFLHKLQLLLSADIAEGELQCFVKAAVYCLVSHMQTVVGYSDVPDLAALLCLEDGLVETGSVTRKRAEGRIVELIDVHIVGLKHLECGFQVFHELVSGLGSCLGCNVIAVSGDALKGNAQLLLAIGILA